MVPSTPQIIPSTPQIVPPMVERPIIQEFVPPAFNKFHQKKSKGKAKARALTAAARNTRKRCRDGVEVKEETQMTQEVIAVRSC